MNDHARITFGKSNAHILQKVNTMKILVTGANGNLGKAISESLAKTATVLAGTRKLGNVTNATNITAVHFDYDAPETFVDATAGIDALVLQAPPLDFRAYERLSPFIDFLKSSGINRIGFVSAMGVEHNDEAPLRKIELKLINEGFDYTFIRPNFFAENFTTGFARDPLLQHQSIAASTGTAKLSFVSTQDIADVFAKILTTPGFEKTAYTLTGAEALSHGDVATLFSSVLGKDIQYVSLSHAEMKTMAINAGVPESAADFLVMLYTIAADGHSATITNDIETILGRPATAFKTVANMLAA